MDDTEKMRELLRHAATNAEAHELKAERFGQFSLRVLASKLAVLFAGPFGNKQRQAEWKFDGTEVSVDLFGRWEKRYGNTVTVPKEVFAELVREAFKPTQLKIPQFGARDWFAFSNVLKKQQRPKVASKPVSLSAAATVGGSGGYFQYGGFWH